ncbi:MAG: hypothetical protein K6T56_08885 [Burkholderiales bacterium]|nr:hypothetical protein [Burkholderiales bacterium]
MISFRKFFSKGPDHPLARDEALTTLLAQLPVNDPTQLLAELSHWLLQLADEAPVKHRATKLYRLDQAGQAAERKLRSQYVESPRLHKAIEERLWNTAYEFLEASINAHFRTLAESLANRREKRELATLAVRTIRRLDLQHHWFTLRYQPPPAEWWDEVYSLIRLAEDEGLMRLPVVLNPTTGTETTFVRELLKLLMATVTEPRQFTKPQLALARHLIDALADEYVWEDLPGATAIFHVDFSRRSTPVRLTPTSERHFMARCFGPGGAVPRLVTALKQVEQGAMPALLGIIDPTLYRRADLLEVLARLAQSLSRSRPSAEHVHFDKRHHARTRSFLQICVIHGFTTLYKGMTQSAHPVPNPATPADSLTYDGQVGTPIFGFVREKTRQQQARLDARPTHVLPGDNEVCESWVVHDVSEKGYGVEITTPAGDWLAPGIAVGIHQDEGWAIAVVRRVVRPSVDTAEVGLEILSRKPTPVMLRPVESELSVWETAADTQTYHHTPAFLLPPEAGLQEEASLLLEPGSYQLHKLYHLFAGGKPQTVKLLDRLIQYGDMDQVIFAPIKPRQGTAADDPGHRS